MPYDPAGAPGGTALDGPPPSPAMAAGANPGVPMSVLAPPPVTPDQIPPEIKTGILTVGMKMVTDLDAFAQAIPDFAPDVAAAKAALMMLFSKIHMAGGGPTAPNAPGPTFPGGGFDRGGMPLASGGL